MANNRQKIRRDVEELESSYRTIAERKQSRFSSKNRHKQKQKSVLIIVSIALILCIIGGIAGYFIYLHMRDNQIITANVTVAGVHVQGQTRKAAIAAVDDAFARNYTGKELQVTVGEHTVVFSAETSAITFNAEAAIDGVLDYNGSDHTEIFDISKYIGLNRNDIMAQLRDIAANYQTTLKQHSYTVTGTVPLNLAEPAEGEGQVLTVTIGTPGMNVDVNMLYDAVLMAYSNNLSSMEYAFPITAPDELDWEKIYHEECIPVVDASVNPETFEITQEAAGYGFLPEDGNGYIANTKPGDVVVIPFKYLLPTITKADLEAEMFRDVLGEMTATAGSNPDRNENLRLACERINNIILLPGQVFSYDKALGPRNKENGWRPGGTYVGNQLVMTYGGGICQVSSALYYASVLADLETVERECHGYVPTYIPYATDATVSEGWIDFKFRNNTDKPIRIEASANGGRVTVRIKGVDERDYYVKFVSETVEWLQPKTIYKEVHEDNNPEGYTDGQVLVGGTTGAISKSYRNKYDKQTHALISSTLENEDEYYVDDRVVVKLIPVATEPPTDTPTEAPTDAPTAVPTEPPTEPPTEAATTEATEAPLTPPDGGIGEDSGS